MDKTTARQTNAGIPTAPLSVGQLRARKKQLKAELDRLIRQSVALERTAPANAAHAEALTGIVDRETELCHELAEIISSIRACNARSRRTRKQPEMAAAIFTVDTATHIDPFFDAPIEVTSCVTNCDSDCVTNCTDGCTLACDSDCRTGCTSGCTFSQSGSNTGSYVITPMITVDGHTDLEPVSANHFSIEWN